MLIWIIDFFFGFCIAKRLSINETVDTSLTISELDGSISDALEVNSIKIEKGVYPIHYSSNTFGTIYLNVEVQ